MQGIWKRLRYYLIGFLIGTIFVSILFKDRGCSWTPANRVKNSIQDKIIVFPEDQIVSLKALGLNKDNIYKFLVNGDVDFSNSLKDKFPKVYIIEENDSIDKRLQFSLYEDSYITIVHALKKEEKPQRYEHLDGWGEMIRLPKDSALVFIDKSNYSQCKARGLATKDQQEIIKAMKTTGRVDFSKSDLMLTKAVQQIQFIQNDTLEVNAKTIWFESRITFKDFDWDYKLDCETE
ncbi:hypothetical protein ERX46_04815 [Brumimicrobium glaciale]|uniref:Uncharacterized protein n=1 Tax=Brumimicrobium glaciale TaxID=200475 RepID=A0A4Q4KRR2_9FLAO|nr:hypothetical protein [Brumimicrobium glaciale]RYM34699.1 hypothetical protein ERX46_04815 [Brumimicrobium glaciale]